MTLNLVTFVRDSNAIEGIKREPTVNEVRCAENFIRLPSIAVSDLEHFVSIVQQGAVLRDKGGLDVRVGNHYPPPGGPGITDRLDAIIGRANRGIAKPYDIHHEYETLHPFTDGNGRSGRILFAWMMEKQGNYMLHNLSFLHTWYYLSLAKR